MSDTVHFEGDPETDSARRQMERLLTGKEPPRRRWPWMVAALGGGGLWLLWNSSRAAARTKDDSPNETRGGNRLLGPP